MRVLQLKLDAKGEARDISGPGVGFRLVPSRPSTQIPSPIPPLTMGWYALVGFGLPGSYPITVELDNGVRIKVVSDASYYFDRPFRSLRVLEGEKDDLWTLQLFEGRGDGVIPSGAKTIVPVLAAWWSIPQVTPQSLPDEGLKLRPGIVGWTAFFVGTGAFTLKIWAASPVQQGVQWYDTGDVVPIDNSLTYPVISRQVISPSDRIAMSADRNGLTCEFYFLYELE